MLVEGRSQSSETALLAHAATPGLVLSSADIAAMLFWALLRDGPNVAAPAGTSNRPHTSASHV